MFKWPTMKIDIKESAIVRPAEDTPNQRLWLSNLDVLFTKRGYIPTLYFYRCNGSSNFFEAKVLKESLSRVLVPYYPVAGRLARDENGRIEINCNGEGVLFVEAETDLALTDLGENFLPSEELLRLIPSSAFAFSSDLDLSSFPLLLLQVTRFACGGATLGVRWHHNLADGAGALHFFKAWSSIACGHSIDILPFLDRTVLRARVPPAPTFSHIEYGSYPSMITGTRDVESSCSDSKAVNSTTILEIAVDQIRILKAMTQNNCPHRTNYSTFEVLCGYIWRTTCKARGLLDSQATALNVVVDGRSRFQPPLLNSYFGNVIFRATSIALCGDILSEQLVKTVDRIHKAIQRMDDEYLRSAVDYVEKLEDHTLSSTMTGPDSCRCPNLHINSWMRLPFRDTDFGWGGPVCMRPANAYEGKGYLLPSSASDGGVSLFICLEAEHMQCFQKLFYDSLHDNQVNDQKTIAAAKMQIESSPA